MLPQPHMLVCHCGREKAVKGTRVSIWQMERVERGRSLGRESGEREGGKEE